LVAADFFSWPAATGHRHALPGKDLDAGRDRGAACAHDYFAPANAGKEAALSHILVSSGPE
jgi:hypothetical protein